MTEHSPDIVTDGAYGTGLATVTPSGTVLDVWYPAPALLMSGRRHPAEQPDLRLAERTDDIRGVRLQVTQTRIASLADAPVDTADTYLRLHLLSARLVAPRSINLDGIFGAAAEQRLDLARPGSAGRGGTGRGWPRSSPASGCRSSAWTSSRG